MNERPVIHLARTEPEDRHPFYEDVRQLLSPGFLTEVVVVNGVRFCLRTFTGEDFFLLRCRLGPDAPEHETKAWMVASAIWMVDGQIVHDHQEALLRLLEMCRGLPREPRDLLYRQIIVLTRRVQEAARRTEAFLYEVESRYQWRSEGLRILERCPLRLGMNQVQRLWAFYNSSEDLREQNLFEWAQTKFVVGTQAPKGIQKLNAKEQRAEAELEQKRQRAQDRMFYLAQGVPFPTEEESRKFYNVNPMETEEDLKAEMGRWLRGEKDWHDRIIDFVKNKIRRSVESRRLEENQRTEELQRVLEDERPTSMEVLSPHLADQLRQRSRAPKRVMHDPTHNSAYDKYLAQDPVAGIMEVDAQGLPKPQRTMSEAELTQLRERLQKGPESDINRYLDSHPPTVEES